MKEDIFMKKRQLLNPANIFIQTATSCNANCVNCPHTMTYKAKKVEHMKNTVWEKILNDLISMDFAGQLGLYLHYEPLTDLTIYNKIKDISTHTKAMATISTNGSLLTEENIHKLFDSNISYIVINMSSANRIKYAQAMDLDFDTTLHNIQTLIRIAGERGVKNKLAGINVPRTEATDINQFNELGLDIKINCESWANSRGGLLPHLSAKGKTSHFKIKKYCAQPETNFNIFCNGDVPICCQDWQQISNFANIMDNTIYEIFNGEVLKAITNKFKNGIYEYEMCKHCQKEFDFECGK